MRNRLYHLGVLAVIDAAAITAWVVALRHPGSMNYALAAAALVLAAIVAGVISLIVLIVLGNRFLRAAGRAMHDDPHYYD